VARRLAGQLEAGAGRRALAYGDASAAFPWRTWDELHRAAAPWAAGLSNRGLKPGDACVLVLPSDEPCALLLLSCLLQGIRPLLVAPPTVQGLRSDLSLVLRGVVRRVEPKLVVIPEAMGSKLDELARLRRGTGLAVADGNFADPGAAQIPIASPAAGDVAALQLTSGTTGFPRVCVWRHRGVLAALDGMEKAMDLGGSDLCLNWTPLYHDMGLVNNFLLCLTKGVPLALFSPLEFVKKPALWLTSLAATGATVTWSPNFGFALCAGRVRDEELVGVRLDHVKAFWNAAERIHYETMMAFERRFAPFGVRKDALKTNFGCAENVGGATFSDPRGRFLAELVDERALHEERVARVTNGAAGPGRTWIVSAGVPCPGVDLRILSPRGRPLPDGHVGEVALRTPSRMVGYLKDRRATRRALMGPWLRTGDLAYQRGREMFWVGRLRERINFCGKKLDPSDFERVLLPIEDLRAGCFAVFGVDDGARGTQRLVVVSEVRQPLRRPAFDVAADVRQRINVQLGVAADEIVLVPSGTLTKTSSGKRRHRHFRGLYRSGELDRLALSLDD
jgi:acyl-CoA synthetase (AMP-forming)/AMP-acid ligase II